MGNLSKYFYEATKHRTCADFIHPSMTCWQSAKICARDGFLGAARFYFPVCFVPMLFKIRKWHKKEEWLKFLDDYARCVAVGFSIAGMSFIYFCILFNIFKKFHFPTLVILPSALGTLYCTLLPEKMLHIDGLGLFNMYIEFFLKQSKVPLIMFMRKSKWSATLVFMFFNAAVMYGLSKTQKHRFWVISPGVLKKQNKQEFAEKPKLPSPVIDRIAPSDRNSCLHIDLSCDNYFIKELINSLKFACAVNTLKVFLPNFKRILTRPGTIPKELITKWDYGLMAFLVLSNCVFRVTQCVLNRRDNSDLDRNNLIAGYLAGACYVFCPKYVIFTLGSTAAIEMLWKSALVYYKENQKELPFLMKFIARLPMSELIFIFAIGMMFQLRVVYPHYTNLFVHRFMAIGTLNKTEFLTKNYAGIMMGFK